MNLRTTILLVLLGACVLPGCADRSPTQRDRPPAAPLATFEGEGNLVDGTLTISSITPSMTAALVQIPEGRPGANVPDTVEVVTDPASVRTVVGGCDTMDGFEGQVSVRSRFAGATLRDVYVEITSLTPSGYEACNSAAPALELDASLGLWSYGTVAPSASVPRTWRFRLPSNTVTFQFRGRVMASGAPTACANGVALPGAPALPLATPGLSSPTSLATGDLNGDGVEDAVVGARDGTAIYVALAAGGGTFLAPVSYAVGSDPRDVALGDLDHDGDLDVVSANLAARSISVLRGNGDGTFAAAVSLTTGTSGPTSVAVGDVTGDAYPEIVVALGDRIGVFPNAAGTIGSVATTAVPSWAAAVLVADLDGSGRGDVAYVSSDIGVMLNDGAGGFAAAVRYAIPSAPGAGLYVRDIAAVDLDGDARPELVAPNGSQVDTEPTLVAVFPNDGAGGFGAASTYSVTGPAAALATGDFDDDGDADVAVTAYDYSDTVSVFLNDGAGVLSPDAVYAAMPNPIQLAAGDFTGAGGVDLLVLNDGQEQLWALPNLGAGVFADRAGTSTGTIADSTPVALATGDLDGDLHQDVVVLNTGSPIDDTMGVYFGRGDGTFEAPVISSTGGANYAVTTGDVDRDGNLDVVVSRSGALLVYRGSADGTLTLSGTYATDVVYQVELADVSGDGWLDLVAPNWSRSRLEIFVNRGDGSFPSTPATYADAYSTPNGVAVADFNGDGALDVVVSKSGALRRLRNNGNGTFTSDGNVLLSRTPVAIRALDVENDGWPDLAIADYDTGTRGLGILPSGKTAASITFGAGVTYGLPYGALNGLAVGDLDGDGFADVVGANSYGQAGLWRNTGAGTFEPMVGYPITLPSARALALPDLNGDFRPDVVAIEGGVRVGRHRLVSALSSCLP